MMTKVSDYIAAFLHEQGVTHLYEVVGGVTAHMIDSVYKQGKIHIVSTHHEQAAAFATDAMGRLAGGIPGVAMATSGPGAVNLLTGIGSCYFDSSPAVFITGQVNRYELKKERRIRQLGFQELDIISLAKPITKGAWQIETPEQVPDILTEAFQLAISMRPGPVLVDIPMDIQRAELSVASPTKISRLDEKISYPEDINKLLADVQKAKRPLILVGGGIRASSAQKVFRKFLEAVRIPVVYSLMAVDVIPYNDPHRVGFIGSYGNRWANLAIGRSDFLLVLGSRLDIRQTGSDIKAFKGNRIIYHVDCEAGEINNRVIDCYPIHSDLHAFLEKAYQLTQGNAVPNYDEWMQEITQLKNEWPDTKEIKSASGINPNELMHHISTASKQASVFTVDVGQHQMWAAQSLELSSHQRFLTSGGMGSMGFSLPAAIGAAMFHAKEPIVVIAGDGGFQLNIQELETVVRNNLPIKIIVLNNHCHGMVRQFQESYFEGRFPSTYWGYSAPNFESVASAYGIQSYTIHETAQISSAMEKLWRDPRSPFLLQVMIDTFMNVYPKIAFGRPITEMEPFAKPIDMEGT